MTKLTPINRSDFVKKLRVFGFEGPYSGGKHSFMIKGKIRLTLPNPHKKEISPALLACLLKQAGITRQDWINL